MDKTKKLLIILAILLIALFLIATRSQGAQTTCEDSNGWTKVDSDDLSLYPVSGATQYCFKAGSDNSQGCTGGIFTSLPLPADACGLSHWAYFIPQITPTPSEGITPTPTTDVPTPTIDRKVTPSVTPTGIQPTPTTVHPTPTAGPGPTSTPAPKVEVPQEGPKTGRGN